MFYASSKSKNNYYHRADCGYSKLIGDKYKLVFPYERNAKKLGLSPCPFCCGITRQYKESQKDVDAFCKHYGFQHFVSSGELFVISSEDTAWRICSASGKEAGNYLLHESKCGVPYRREETPYEKRTYHVQKLAPKSLMDYLACILDHDLYEKERTERIMMEREQKLVEISAIRAIQARNYRQNLRKRGSIEDYGQKRRRYNQQLRALASAYSEYYTAKAASI